MKFRAMQYIASGLTKL
uniref:Uncharacterized protein n=1 Tax=Rhizophora mucronata TaxID=61149 RepID=A0A2P2QCR5_RHIMU